MVVQQLLMGVLGLEGERAHQLLRLDLRQTSNQDGCGRLQALLLTHRMTLMLHGIVGVEFWPNRYLVDHCQRNWLVRICMN